MIGIGSKVYQNNLVIPSSSPFSVQANYVAVANQIQSVPSGSTREFSYSNWYWKWNATGSKSPMPYGGKIVQVKMIHHKINSDIGYIVILKNGVEQADSKVSFSSNDEVNKEYFSSAEIEFNAGDEIAVRFKSTSGQLDFDDMSVYVVTAFNIGSSTP